MLEEGIEFLLEPSQLRFPSKDELKPKKARTASVSRRVSH